MHKNNQFRRRAAIRGCLKTADCYDIPPFRQAFELFTEITAGTWNRRNNCKNNGSMSFCSFVASDDGMLFLLEGLNFETASLDYTSTPKPRKASLSEVLRSVLSLRCPMMSAQLTLNSPPGNFLV